MAEQLCLGISLVECQRYMTEFCVQLGKSASMEPHQNICHTVQIKSHAISGLLQP